MPEEKEDHSKRDLAEVPTNDQQRHARLQARPMKHTRDDFVRLSRCLPVWTSDNNPDSGSEDLRGMSVQQVANFQYQKGQKHVQDKEWEVRFACCRAVRFALCSLYNLTPYLHPILTL
jgi:hypothetical protein